MIPPLPTPPVAAGLGFSFADGSGLVLVLTAVALFAAVGALSHEHERPFSSAVVYLVLGLALAVGLSALGLRRIDPIEDHALIEHITEFAVIVAVFSSGLKVQRALRWRPWKPVVALLAVVMPLTIAAVALFGVAAMGLSLAAAVVLGGILAPTDPVLAGGVAVGPPGEEDQEEENDTKFALSGEAALNDGLASPFVFLGLFLAGNEGAGFLGEWVLADLLYATLGAVAIGYPVGWLLAALFLRLRERHLLDRRFQAWAGLAVALLLYGVAEVAGTYGFVAAFVGGFAFRRYEYGHEYNREVHDGLETVEKFLELAVILLLGSLVTLGGLGEPGLSGWLLVPLLLFVIRPLVVLVTFARYVTPWRERLFLAWFGVKGVASLNYATVAVGAGVLSEGETAVVVWTVVACVIVSILLHGVTGTPLTGRLLEEQGEPERDERRVPAGVR